MFFSIPCSRTPSIYTSLEVLNAMVANISISYIMTRCSLIRNSVPSIEVDKTDSRYWTTRIHGVISEQTYFPIDYAFLKNNTYKYSSSFLIATGL